MIGPGFVRPWLVGGDNSRRGLTTSVVRRQTVGLCRVDREPVERPDLERHGTARVQQIGGRLARYHPHLTGLGFSESSSRNPLAGAKSGSRSR